ncbi:MAG: hypothetical protein HOI59_07530 [Nitrospina sp.]|jgi:hypothetical protein|nr:hypothetical protein [Nitrospina sp.]MBT3414054.1 hypothetical protein [Nitrospina sp.]MBT3858108.1 hypothetical protein [Nitrospina sp.]MBT4104523.1 hypothetical protein [Nitrospina sp.]MBT4389888.1 hypothetical protein [Nitrospina sp.]
MMSNTDQDKDHKEEESSGKKKEETRSENKPSRLAERKGQRPTFPFKRKPV